MSECLTSRVLAVGDSSCDQDPLLSPSSCGGQERDVLPQLMRASTAKDILWSHPWAPPFLFLLTLSKDLDKHDLRIVSRFRLHAHHFQVESRMGGSGMCVKGEVPLKNFVCRSARVCELRTRYKLEDIFCRYVLAAACVCPDVKLRLHEVITPFLACCHSSLR